MKENNDIQFLKDLQHELNNQDHDIQAAPRFWVVGDYRWVSCPDGIGERVVVYLPDAAEAYEINDLLKDIRADDLEDMSDDAKEGFGEIECEASAFDWIQEHYDEGATLHCEEKVHFVRENTMFLTKAEAKQHIERNRHNYTDEAHTYAMTALRAPKVARLLDILETFDFSKLESQEQPNV